MPALLSSPTDCNPTTHPLHLCLSTMGNESRILATNPSEKVAGALKRKRQGDGEKTDRGELGARRQTNGEGQVNSFVKWLTCTERRWHGLPPMFNIIFISKTHHTNRNGVTLFQIVSKKKQFNKSDWGKYLQNPELRRFTPELSFLENTLICSGDMKEFLERRKIDGTIRMFSCLQLKHSRDWFFNQSFQIFRSSTAHYSLPIKS